MLISLIGLIPLALSEKCIFLCSNNWVKKQAPVVICRKKLISNIHKFYKKTPVKFVKFLRTPILKNISERLLLWVICFVKFSRFKAHDLHHT